MKKFLALVLALVMTMSLVTISAGAEFTDADSINYEEAVDVMTAVKVVDGLTDGSFNPQGGLTRGAAAKIICNMVLGPTTAGALIADTAPYSDVAADSTYAGYIAYCKEQGIVSGYADGSFHPAAPLNGYAFMKMLLGALGYDKDAEGYEGANWSINVAKQALAIGLDAGLVDEFVGSDPITREEALLFAFNAMRANMVEYKNAGTITVGDLTIKNNAVYSDVATTAGTVDFDGALATDKDTTLQFCEKYFKDLKLTNNADDLNRAAREWTWKNVVVGTYCTDAATLTYTATVKAADMAKNLKSYTFAPTAEVYVNGYDGNVSATSADQIAALTGDGRVVELYITGTQITKVVVINSYIAEVVSVDTKAEKVTYSIYKDGGVAANIKAEIGYGDFAKEDYVVVTPVFSGASTIDATEEPVEAIAAEKVTGTTSWVKADGKQITVDGTTYKLAANASTESGAYTFGSALATGKVDVDLYLDANGYVVYGTNAETIDNYIMVIKSWDAADDYATTTRYIQGVLVDGTIKTFAIKSTDTTSLNYTYNSSKYIVADAATGALPAALFSYTMDGEYIKLAAVNAKYADVIDTTSAYDADDKYVTDGTNKLYYGDVTFVMAAKSGADAKASVVEGAQKIAASALAWVIHEDDTKGGTNFTASHVFLYGNTAVASQDLIYINSNASTGWNNTVDKAEYTAYINGEKTTITTTGMTANKFYTYAIDEKGCYELTQLADSTDDVHGLATLSSVYTAKSLVSFGTPSLTDYDASAAQIIDLTDNGITTLDGMKSLLANCTSGTVKCGIVYDDVAETVSYIYIVSAGVAPTNAGTTVTFTGVDGSDVSKVEYTITRSAVAQPVVTLTSVTDGSGSFTFTATGLTTGDKLSVTVTTVDGYIYTGVLDSAV